MGPAGGGGAAGGAGGGGGGVGGTAEELKSLSDISDVIGGGGGKKAVSRVKSLTEYRVPLCALFVAFRRIGGGGGITSMSSWSSSGDRVLSFREKGVGGGVGRSSCWKSCLPGLVLESTGGGGGGGGMFGRWVVGFGMLGYTVARGEGGILVTSPETLVILGFLRTSGGTGHGGWPDGGELAEGGGCC